VEIVNKETEEKIITESKLIYGTDKERCKMPLILHKLKEMLLLGSGGVTIKVKKLKDGSKKISIRRWEDED